MPEVDKFKSDILDAMKNENNPRFRARFIELLGYCSDENLITIFEDELKNTNADIITWALFSLENHPSKNGISIAKKFKANHPEFS